VIALRDGLTLTDKQPKKKTDIQRIVEAYKESKGVAMDNKGWDRANFSRYSKAAKSLLDCFAGDIEKSAVYLFMRAQQLDEMAVDWTLETIVRHAWDGLGMHKERNGQQSSTMGSDRLLGQGRTGFTTPAGKIVSDTLRDIRSLGLHGKESTDMASDWDDPFDDGQNLP